MLKQFQSPKREKYPTAIYGVLPTHEMAEKFIKQYTPEKTIIQEFKDLNRGGTKTPWAKEDYIPKRMVPNFCPFYK